MMKRGDLRLEWDYFSDKEDLERGLQTVAHILRLQVLYYLTSFVSCACMTLDFEGAVQSEKRRKGAVT